MTMASPGRTSLSHNALSAYAAGMIEPVPQKTSGLPAKRSSKTMAPPTVGTPDLLPPSSMPLRTPAKTREG